MTDVLPYRRYDEHGRVAARDGLVFVLFIPYKHHEIADAVGEFYERYLNWVGTETLGWVHDRGEDFRPFTSRMRTSVRKKLSSKKARPGKSYLLTIQNESDEGPTPVHRFRYYGEDSSDGPAPDPGEPAYSSYIEIWLPSEFPEEEGIEELVDMSAALSQLLPYASGYCSLAINYEAWCAGDMERQLCGLAARHPGLDVHANVHTSDDIGLRVRGAYWLTLLGPAVLERLGIGAEAIREKLEPEIEVRELSNGVLIRAGERPEVGDVNRGENLPLVRKVAALLEPVQFIQTTARFLYREEDRFVAWQKRHTL